jgi:hypothetical protein
MNLFNPFLEHGWVFLPLIVWTLFWKGYSLWVSAKNNQKKWFVVLLIFNTFGILEIIYIFYVAKKNSADIKRIFTKFMSWLKGSKK